MAERAHAARRESALPRQPRPPGSRGGLVDRVAESHEEERSRLERLDVRMVKELTIRAGWADRPQLLVLARALAALAEAPPFGSASTEAVQ